MIAYVCDGCGKASTATLAELGAGMKRHYCEACEPNAREFIAAEEALRLETQEQFISKRSILIEKHGADGFKLPDVIHAE